MQKNAFGFGEHQEKVACGLGDKLTLARNSDNSVLEKVNAINVGENKSVSIEL